MNGRTSHADTIANTCKQLGRFRDASGSDEESIWYANIALASHCREGEKFALAYSGRTEEETNEAFEFAQDLPPTTCERFQKINPEGCEGCPHKGKITSPIQLVKTGSQSARSGGLHLSSNKDVENIQETQARPARILDRFGWHGDSFLCGHRLYTASGVEQAEVTDDLDIKALRLGPGTGSLSGWTAAANKLFAAGFEPVSFGLLCSFAAPIVPFHSFGEGGVVVSTYSGQSKGSRTLALHAAASVWGQPNCTDFDRTSLDHNLPITCEDITKRDPELIGKIIGQFFYNSKTILLLSATRPLEFDEMVIEFKSSFPRGHFYQNDMELIEHELFANAGWAGDSYLRYLVQPAVLEHVKNVLPLRQQQIRDELAAEKHRVWARPIAACIVGGTIVRHLGLADFSLQRVVKWAIEKCRNGNTMPLAT